MAKPIAIIYIPDRYDGGRDRNWIYEYARYLNGEQTDNPNWKINWGDRKDYWTDYYWFCFYKRDIDEPEFKVFYEKDFTDIQFAELKELITQSINDIPHGQRN